MKILVFLFVILNKNLVLTHENVAIENSITHQNTYEVHPNSEDINFDHDQVAESSHSNTQTYVNEGNKVSDGSSSQIQTGVNEGQIVQKAINLPENLRYNTAASNVEVLEPALSQYSQGQPIYVQQYSLQPIRIFGAEASPYHQVHENEAEKALGYSSYIEHVSEKDEEINSALKEGSINDIKRLVPKSGISFKIYHKEKNVDLENQKTETRSNHNALNYIHSKTPYNPRQKNNIKPDIPRKTHTTYIVHQPLSVESSTKANEQQHKLENFQHLLQTSGLVSHSQDYNENLNYAQPAVNSLPDVNSKSSLLEQSHFKLNEKENNYNKATSVAGINSLSANGNVKHVNNLQYHNQWGSNSKTEELQKALENVKPVSEEQYETDQVSQAERIRELHFSQNNAFQSNFNKFKTNSPLTELANNNANNFQSNSFTVKANQNNFDSHLAGKAYAENKLVNRLTGNYIKAEKVKPEQNHIINLGTSAYGESQAYKINQNQHFVTNSLYDSETAKSNQHNLISHVAKNSFVEAKNTQNNFDHQKALEGSTSFDIKNAIDNAGNLIHENSVAPGADIHHTEDFQKQQLAYVIPKIPASTVLVGNGLHASPIIESQHIKDFEISPPQTSYHSFSSPEINGKFFQQPAIFLPSEHLKQGNALTVNDLHQPIIRLHVPKEEIYQHIKVPNLELPTSSLSHISYQQQEQPYVLHYDIPSVKYPHEFAFQPKSKTRAQNPQVSHIKLSQPVTMDWSLFKSTYPNFNLNSLVVKPELLKAQESGKKIVPILVRKRKNRSNNKQETGVIYGKVNSSRRPTKPTQRHEKAVRHNLHSEASNNIKQFESNRERKNEFSVSASYKVDRSLKTTNNA